MVHSLLAFVSLATVLPALVAAHGQLGGVTIDGQWYDAPNLYYDGDSKNANTPIRKGYQASSPSYLLPKDFSNDNKMACEEAGAAPAVAVVKPGSEIKWRWDGATPELTAAYGANAWVHAMGPTITYIGSCNGDCKTVDASQIGWQKIDFNGLSGGNIEDKLRDAMAAKPEPYRSQGVWALASLIENDSTYTSHVPQNLKNGQYILRSELSAVHNPLNPGDQSTGPQNYVGCLQIEVQNGGDVELPYGTKAGSLYAPDGDFAKYSVFNSPASFNEPGPATWNGASASGSSSNSGSSGNSNTGSNSGDNSNQNSNTGSGNSGDNSNQNSNTGSGNSGDNSNQNQNTGSSGSSGDNSNQNQNTGNTNSGDNSNTNSGSGNSSSTSNSDGSSKQCRRRSNSRKRAANASPRVARSMHGAHKKRIHH